MLKRVFHGATAIEVLKLFHVHLTVRPLEMVIERSFLSLDTAWA